MTFLKQTACYHYLIGAIIGQAVDDIKGTFPLSRTEKDRAMAFIMSDVCEAYCWIIGLDCKTLREKAAALKTQ